MRRLQRESAGRGCAAWQSPRPAAARRTEAPRTVAQMPSSPAISMARRSDCLSILTLVDQMSSLHGPVMGRARWLCPTSHPCFVRSHFATSLGS